MGWSYFDFAREIRASGLPATDRLVLLALALRADQVGECYPSLPTLAADTGLHRATVQRSVQRLLGGTMVSAQERQGLTYTYRLQGGRTERREWSQPATSSRELPVAESDGGGRTELPVPVAQSDGGGRTERHDLPTDLPKDPPKKRPKGGRPRGSRVPEDWKPTEPTVLWCRKHGLKPEEISPAAEEFVDFWTARVPDGKEIKTAKGWQAAFKNRIRGSKWVDPHPSYRDKEIEILAPKPRPEPSKQQSSGAGAELLRQVARGELAYEQLPAAMQPAHIRAATEREIDRLRGEMGDQQQLAIGGAK